MKENQELVQTPGMTPTSDSINTGITHLIRAMKADFAQKFSSRFVDERDLRDYKQRLRKLFENHSVSDIYDAYESYLDTRPEWPPTNIDLKAHLEDLLKERRRIQANKAEAAALSALPAPKITHKPLEMLAKAKATAKKIPNETAEQRANRLNGMLMAHEALMVLHSRHIKRHRVLPSHACAYPGCYRAGAISDSTRGGGNFYCGTHWQGI